LEELFDALPIVISKITGKTSINSPNIKVFFKKAYG
jgi:hypothetical protein